MRDDMGLVEVFNYILAYFKNDYAKTLIWFGQDNPLLGDASPIWMIKAGREDKLIKFIRSRMDGHQP